MICDAIEDYGYLLSEAHNGRQAIVLAQSTNPDLILLDLEMPQMDGLECLRKLQADESTKHIPVIIVTGSHVSKKIDAVLEAGAIDFIAKPFSTTILKTRVRDIEERHNREAELLAMKSSLEASIAELEMLTRCDPLTGICNRRSFFELCQIEWSRSERHGIPLSCVVLDADFFKRVNDNYGHQFGDHVLKQIAKIMSDFSRSSDVVCRYGGEEFVAFLPETDERQAASWAEKMRIAMEELKLTTEGVHVPITISLGVAQRLDDTESPESLIDLADQALAIAKQKGRNQVVEHSSSLTDLFSDNTGIVMSLVGKYAGDIMCDGIPTVEQNDSFRKAQSDLFEFQFESIPVIDHSGNLVGVLTERRILETLRNSHAEEKIVEQIMIRGVVSFDVDTLAEEVLRFLQRVAMNRIIVTRENRPVGIITRRSFVQWYHKWTLQSKNSLVSVG